MTTQSLQKIGFIYAAIVVALLLAAHISALFHQTAPWEISYGMAFLMIFPMWVLMIFYLNKRGTGMNLTDEEIQNLTLVEKLKTIIDNPPHWLFVLTCLLYAYGSVLFFLVGSGLQDTELVNGQYQIFNHGQITHYTQAEYQNLHRNNILGTTSFFLMFASVAFTVFFPKKTQQ